MTHVLVTRPLDASTQLAGGLTAMGLTPIVMPMYAFVGCRPQAGSLVEWSESSGRKLAVFTSPRAVQFGLPFMPLPDQLENMEIAVVGSATIVELESAGFPVHIQAAAGFTSEDLLQVPRLAENPGAAIIFCAPGGRKTLLDGLNELGWNTTMAMVYERVPLQTEPGLVDELRSSEELVSVWTSISALMLAQQYLPGDVWGKILASPALVISSRIQHYLEQLGASGVELSGGPGNPELLRSIRILTGHSFAG
jgi:uroporphyrinogen-III synthase